MQVTINRGETNSIQFKFTDASIDSYYAGTSLTNVLVSAQKFDSPGTPSSWSLSGTPTYVSGTDWKLDLTVAEAGQIEERGFILIDADEVEEQSFDAEFSGSLNLTIAAITEETTADLNVNSILDLTIDATTEEAIADLNVGITFNIEIAASTEETVASMSMGYGLLNLTITAITEVTLASMSIETLDISELIDKQDNFEIVRDKIAEILVAAVARQMALAVLAGKDPDLWKLRIFLERSNPFEQFLNCDGADLSPLVNIWVDNSQFDPKASNVMERQKSETIYNLDCYGIGVSADDVTGGHVPGDEKASFEVQRAVRLVRNIIMSAENTYLQSRRTVWGRWPRSIEFFQPQIDNHTVEQVKGARISLKVDFNEFSPQYIPENLELITTSIK
ncbi:MAG: hypothetical protein GY869_19085, partial [Planctomycetes bacterium]|nr:hypothetical protein [Planctomycetota bacterium]